MPMSRLVQRGPVVDAVAGHRHHVAAGLQRAGDAQLVLGRDPGEHDAVAVEQRAEQLLVVGQVRALERPGRPASRRPDLGGDRASRRRVVAGDHRDPDAGAAGRRRCAVGTLGRGGSSRPSRPSSSRSSSAVVAELVAVDRRRPAGGDGEHPQPAAAPSHRRASCGAGGVVAAGEHGVRRALDGQHVADDDRHAAAARVERESAHAGSRPRRRGVDAEPAGERVDRRLHRVALRRPTGRRARTARPVEQRPRPRASGRSSGGRRRRRRSAAVGS